jgi:hypothetical protein
MTAASSSRRRNVLAAIAAGLLVVAGALWWRELRPAGAPVDRAVARVVSSTLPEHEVDAALEPLRSYPVPEDGLLTVRLNDGGGSMLTAGGGAAISLTGPRLANQRGGSVLYQIRPADQAFKATIGTDVSVLCTEGRFECVDGRIRVRTGDVAVNANWLDRPMRVRAGEELDLDGRATSPVVMPPESVAAIGVWALPVARPARRGDVALPVTESDLMAVLPAQSHAVLVAPAGALRSWMPEWRGPIALAWTAGNPRPLIAGAAADGDALRKLGTRSAADVHLEEVTTASGGLLLLATPPSAPGMPRVRHAEKPEESLRALASHPVNTMLAEAPEPLLWGRVPALVELVPGVRPEVARRLGLASAELVFGARPQGDALGLRALVYVPHLPEAAPPAAGAAFRAALAPGAPAELLDAIPANASLAGAARFASMPAVAQWWETRLLEDGYGGDAELMAQQRADAAATVGFDALRDLVPLLDGRVAVAFRPTGTGGADVLVLAGVTDEEAVRALFRRNLALLSAEENAMRDLANPLLQAAALMGGGGNASLQRLGALANARWTVEGGVLKLASAQDMLVPPERSIAAAPSVALGRRLHADGGARALLYAEPARISAWRAGLLGKARDGRPPAGLLVVVHAGEAPEEIARLDASIPAAADSIAGVLSALGLPMFEDVESRTRLERTHANLDRVAKEIADLVQSTGTAPASLDDLAGRLGADALADPFTGERLGYLRDDETKTWRLWSRGPDQRDNRGILEWRPELGPLGRGDIVRRGAL